eukprot:EG_transcript_3395
MESLGAGYRPGGSHRSAVASVAGLLGLVSCALAWAAATPAPPPAAAYHAGATGVAAAVPVAATLTPGIPPPRWGQPQGVGRRLGAAHDRHDAVPVDRRTGGQNRMEAWWPLAGLATLAVLALRLWQASRGGLQSSSCQPLAAVACSGQRYYSPAAGPRQASRLRNSSTDTADAEATTAIEGAALAEFFGRNRRTRLNGEYRDQHVGEKVRIYGWVAAYRNQGALVFVDVRDRSGLVQLRFDPNVGDGAAFRLAKQLRAEWVIGVEGEVLSRGANANDKVPTGAVEVLCTELVVLSEARTPPFEVKDEVEVGEALRLKHRYLDLRRPRLTKNFVLRSKVQLLARQYFAEHGFLEIETPVLANPTPEGARDYLVPSRVHPGRYYALPQSPQQFKQLLMMSGMDRYMQICRCFRDEDLRADRQPEFTQLDLELSFVTVDDIRALLDGFVQRLWKEALGIDIPIPLPTMLYSEAMEKYGIDRPDLRFGLPLTDLTAIMRGRVEFKVFNAVLEAGGIVKALYIPNGGAFSRSDLEKAFLKEVLPFGAKGVAWARVVEDGGWTGPVAKGVGDALRADLNAALGAEEGGVILFCADKPAVANAALARLRVYVGERLGLLDPTKWAFTWVLDFPMFEYSEEDARYYAMHHPFTSPRYEDLAFLETDPGKVRAQAYDLVLNGTELGGGSIRIHRSDIQDTVFRLLGLGQEERRAKFGFFLEALQYGTPPHGGLALGLDRLMTYLCGADSLRDVIAFPKTLRATDLLTGSPSVVGEAQVPGGAPAPAGLRAEEE